MTSDRRLPVHDFSRDPRQQARVLDLINRLYVRLLDTDDTRSLARHALEILHEFTGTPQAVFFLLDESSRYLIPLHAIGFGEAYFRLYETSGGRLPVTGSLNGIALDRRRIVYSSDIQTDARAHPMVRSLLEQEGIHSVVCIPLHHDDRCIGVLDLLNSEIDYFRDTPGNVLEAIGNVISVTLSRQLHLRQIEYQARHDMLTGLPNRRAILEAIDQALESEQAGLVLLDIDRFKEINDGLGHGAGDRLLGNVAQRLKQALEGTDTLLGRLGGDEFAIVVREAPETTFLDSLVERLQQAFSHPVRLDGLQIDIEASLGIAVSEPGIDSNELLRRADVAMYTAKKEHVHHRHYDPASDPHTPERIMVLTDLGRAIHEGSLELHFQPQIELSSGRCVGMEALVRWPHPEMGMMLPDRFMPLAEAGNLICPLTARVSEMAFEQLARWREHWPDRMLHIAINLSTRNLMDSGCVRHLLALPERTGLDACAVELEITESALLPDPARAMKHLEMLSEAGYSIAIDDFGTGYSSLAYLKQLPIDRLKIDRTFIRDLFRDEQDAIIVRSTIGLARNLGLHVTAEGVEDRHALDALRVMGCDLAQGNAIAPPMPADEATRYLSRLSEDQ
ncbi:MAG TPA: GGDEF domain-containing protein [Thiotrichales bacterium]|nr:GGDEF domain-containing protein [Thiotrichales bacterium]